MSTYKRGGIWWYRFKFAGQTIRESTKSASRVVARDAERARRRELEEGFNGLTKPQRAQVFSAVAEQWLAAKSAHLAPRSITIECLNLKHLNPVFGNRLLCDISADDIAAYQVIRLKEGAAPKTVNLEIGTVRAILRRNRLWANLQPDVKMLRVREDVGRALTEDEESRLLDECGKSRSRSLYAAVALALNTCMRYSEIRLLHWYQLDLRKGVITVGSSKTEAGDGRVIPINERLRTVLEFWADMFSARRPEDFVFPAEKYGAAGDSFQPCVYAVDLRKPIGDWKKAWETAKERAGVQCRFHDLRHTGCTRMLERGVPFPVVSEVMGWSASTAIRMAKRYGHIGNAARREAVGKLSSTTMCDAEGAQKWAQSRQEKPEESGKSLKRYGSSGRTRTYNPPVNSRMLCH